MESEKARLRMYHLACHLESGLRLQSATSLVRSECSFSRRDSAMLFARQGMESRGQFMRPGDTKQTTDVQVSLVEAEKKQAKPPKATTEEKKDEEPLYSKAVNFHENAAPLFARATDKQVRRTKCQRQSPVTSGFEWCPRMDVMESDTEYNVTVELPGVNSEHIRVEIDGGRLVITGSRPREWYASADFCKGNKIYHVRDLSYGPYRSVWTLPKNADVNGATAEFVDGFLRVIIPKM